MESLKDKKIHIRNKKSNDINNYCFEGRDVKEAVLEFEKRFYNRNKSNTKDTNKKIIDLFKEIFGDFKDDIQNIR